MKKTAALLLLILSGCASPADDLHAICEEVNNPALADTTPEMRAMTLAKNIDARLKTDPIRNAWDAIASAQTDQKYKLLQKAAVETGVEGWECPALAELWTAPPVEEPAEEPPPQAPPTATNGSTNGSTNGATNGGEVLPPG